jgi:hypothetical protein
VVAHDARFEFPDVIGFADGGPGGGRWNAGPWAASGRMHRPATLAKRGGGVRVLAVLDPAVHARYRAAVATVAGAVERSLGPEVTAGRCVAHGRRLSIESWRPAWRRHLRRSRRVAAAAGHVLRMDIRDCFGTIEPEVVGQALRRAGAEPEDARRVTALLEGFRSDGVRGIPVGPEPSGVLANAVLARADLALRSLGLPFARWCDDVTIGLLGTDPAGARDAWAEALQGLGLGLATEKTRVDDAVRGPEPSMLAVPAGPPIERGAAGRPPSAPTPGSNRAGRRVAAGVIELAAAAGDEPDPHVARAMVAAAALCGGRQARMALRHVRRRAPYLRSTVDWGLRR